MSRIRSAPSTRVLEELLAVGVEFVRVPLLDEPRVAGDHPQGLLEVVREAA